MQFDMGRESSTGKIVSSVNFPEYYQFWLDHDVDRCDNWLFRDLSPSDLYLYWDALERKYLDRYRTFLRLEYEFGCSGLVSIDFPGAMCISPYIAIDEVLSVPLPLYWEIRGWCELADRVALGHGSNEDNNHEYSWGLEVAKKVALYVPKDIYFEYFPLQQIGVRKGRGVVLGCDPEINELLHLYPEGVLPRF